MTKALDEGCPYIEHKGSTWKGLSKLGESFPFELELVSIELVLSKPNQLAGFYMTATLNCNPFHVNVLWFFCVFRGYRKRAVAWNLLKYIKYVILEVVVPSIANKTCFHLWKSIFIIARFCKNPTIFILLNTTGKTLVVCLSELNQGKYSWIL